MGDIADLVAQVGHIELTQIEVVEQNLPFVRAVEGHHQTCQGAFARAAAANDADALASCHAQADTCQGGRALSWVVEGDVAYIQCAMQVGAIQWPLF